MTPVDRAAGQGWPAAMPLDSLLRLPQRGAAGLDEILRLAARGDWQTRALALSATGQIARADPYSHRVHPFRHWVALRIPRLKRRFPSVGYQARYVRRHIADGLVDRSWIVRVAAALALGECRVPAMAEALRPLLGGPYRAERIAAAAAMVCSGDSRVPPPATLLQSASAAPVRVGDTTTTIDFLTLLTSAHLGVLNGWLTLGGERPLHVTADAWASYLAGTARAGLDEGIAAEAARYDAGHPMDYLLAKPFSPINRTQNARLLHSFLVVAEQLKVPPRGRILDLGAGPGWVSELLAKLGYRPIALDLSWPLLTIAKRRFDREHLRPQLAVADMTALPIATASMNAVVVIDALHHVPDVPAVFREAYRVLADGGQLALAEPGEGHSDSEKSRSEMLEHGVHEREIHLFEVIDYGRTAGFTGINIVPHFVPHVSMTPDDVRDAMAAQADKWRIRRGDQPGLFPQFVLQSILDRPIVVFSKGRRPVDSLMPQKLKADLAAHLSRTGVRVSGRVTARNIGDTLWRGGGNETGDVRLGIQLLDADHHLLDQEFGRVPLGADVVPLTAVDIDVSIELPDEQRRYVLKLDLVDEGICWFEDVGSRPVYVSLP